LSILGLQLRLAKVKSDDREDQGDVVEVSTEGSSVEEQVGSEDSERASSDGDRRWAARHLGLAMFRCVVGLVMLVVGAHYLVDGAVQLATMWGVSEVIIGLTVIAIGTSLPEVVTSIVASLRGQRDLSVGNVVGSNLFNILAVLGISVIVSPSPIEVQESLLQFDMPVMMLASVICLPIFMTGKGVSRLEGLLLFLSYLAYVGYQIYIVAQFPK
jgi:cation:H+ antiporter